MINSDWHSANRMPENASMSQRMKWHLEHARECGCRAIPQDILEEILRRFETPEETRTMIKGRFEVATIEGMTIGKATYQPGWKWSEHVGPSLGKTRCDVEHLGLVVSGNAVAAYNDGRIDRLETGKRFYVPSDPHDSWVVGDEEYVSLHFVGAETYSKSHR